MSHFSGSKDRAKLALTNMAAAAVILLSTLLPWNGQALAAWENDFYSLIFDDVSSSTSDEVRSCSDEMGGMLVALVDDYYANSIGISRIDHMGNEVWGDEGESIPFSVGADDLTGPMDIAPDGTGGVYCAFREIWGSSHYLVVAHLLSDGSFDWLCYVADIGDPSASMYPWVILEPTGDGEVIVGWLNAVLGDEKVVVARVSGYGTVLWQTDISPSVWTDLYQVNWNMVSDAQGGVLLCYSNLEIGSPLTAYVQRVSGAGALLWGANGHALDTTYFLGLCPIMHDGAGGLWIAQEDVFLDQVRLQHIGPGGNEYWSNGGIVALPYEGRPVLCEDGGGGVYLALTEDPGGQNHDIIMQHVDAWGNLPWGASGLAVADQAGGQINPQICSDGSGGVFLGYEEWYYVEIGASENRVPGGAHLDAFGNELMPAGAIWFNGWDDGLEPSMVVPIADGSGGVMFNWSECSGSLNVDQVYALGLNGAGGAASPTLSNINPDAGYPGGSMPVMILGEYLEAGQSFKLQRAGFADLPITGNTFISYQIVEGMLDLSLAEVGAYDLVVSVDGTPADTLFNAFGAGEPPHCEGDQPFLSGTAQALSSGSQRKAAFASDGDACMAWLEYEGPDYLLTMWKGNEGGNSYTVIHRSTAPMRELSFATDPVGGRHMTWVKDLGGDEWLHYIGVSADFDIVADSLMFDDGVRNPAIGVDIFGGVHIVIESDIMSESWLFHMQADAEGLHGASDMISGAGATNPDLTAYGDGLMVTYVRNHWFPGLREVCYQYGEGDEWGVTWDSPVGFYFGLFVSSPSVAWDHDQELLFSFILDNTGTAPLLHTAHMVAGELAPVRWRLGDPTIFRTSVGSTEPGHFYLLTQESEGSFPMKVFLRQGDGEVFYPKLRLNSSSDVDMAYFAVQPGDGSLIAFWEEYDDTLNPFHFYVCWSDGTPVDESVPVAAAMGAFPNPFNPTTTIAFTQPEAGWTRMALYDISGRRVRLLLDGQTDAGSHQLIWDGRNEEGTQLPSGVYFIRLILPGSQGEKVSKLTLLK